MKRRKIFERSPMVNRYMMKSCGREMIFVIIFVIYIRHRDWMTLFPQQSLLFVLGVIHLRVTPLHIIWVLFMALMLLHIFPGSTQKLTMALRKSKKQTYIPVEGYSEFDLLKYIQRQNIHAWEVMLTWLSFNAVFGNMYLVRFLEEADLLMLTVFYFLCDYICILIFFLSRRSLCTTNAV